MNNEIKVNLTVVLPGRTMMSEQECSENPKENYDTFSLQIVDNDKGKDKRYTISPKLRKSVPATQSMNISREAYNYMSSIGSCPAKVKLRDWEHLHPRQRLEYHLRMICESVKGVKYSYVIFSD